MQRLSQDEGVNLAGIKRIIDLETHVDALQAKVAELAAELDRAQAELARRTAPVHRARRLAATAPPMTTVGPLAG